MTYEAWGLATWDRSTFNARAFGASEAEAVGEFVIQHSRIPEGVRDPSGRELWPSWAVKACRERG